jgi:hypothetical protein
MLDQVSLRNVTTRNDGMKMTASGMKSVYLQSFKKYSIPRY